MLLDSFVVAWCFLALFSGGLIKGALGVGTPLLPVPLMALVLPAQTAVALMAIPVVVANLWQVSQATEIQTVIRRFWPAFVAVLIGTYTGVKILQTIDEKSLLLFVGAIVILFALLQVREHRFQFSELLEKPAGFCFGLASGIIGGVSSMFGPMLIIYLVSVQGLDKNSFVGAISFLYVAAVVPWVAMLYAFGILDAATLGLSALATIPVWLGMIVGRSIRNRVSESRFHRLVLLVLLASGGTMLWRAFA